VPVVDQNGLEADPEQAGDGGGNQQRVLSPQPRSGRDGDDGECGNRPEPDAGEEIAPEKDQRPVMLHAAPRQQQGGNPAGDQPEPDSALPWRAVARAEQSALSSRS
jgi:hypothetical protein